MTTPQDFKLRAMALQFQRIASQRHAKMRKHVDVYASRPAACIYQDSSASWSAHARVAMFGDADDLALAKVIANGGGPLETS